MTTARELIEQGEAIGMAKGRVEGGAKGRAETRLLLLRLRFGVLSAATVERVTTADAASLDRWGSVDEVLAG